MLKSVEIRDYMNLNPVKVLANDNLFKAIEIILDNKVSGACVVDEEGQLLGIISELDCLRAIVSATYNKSGEVGNVSDHMNTNVITCSLQDNIVDVANNMLADRHRRRPVVSDGKLVGQITCRQLLRVVNAFHELG